MAQSIKEIVKIPNVIGLKALRENMNDFIEQTKKGRSFLVVRKSKPVFRITPADVWGDEGLWETVVDLTKIRKGGVPVEEVLSALK